jgi:Ca2+-binding EF-hand superfamily protein
MGDISLTKTTGIYLPNTIDLTQRIMQDNSVDGGVDVEDMRPENTNDANDDLVDDNDRLAEAKRIAEAVAAKAEEEARRRAADEALKNEAKSVLAEAAIKAEEEARRRAADEALKNEAKSVLAEAAIKGEEEAQRRAELEEKRKSILNDVAEAGKADMQRRAEEEDALVHHGDVDIITHDHIEEEEVHASIDAVPEDEEVTVNFTPEELAAFSDSFFLFDADGSGAIDIHEIGNVMRSVGYVVTEKSVQEMMVKYDTNGDGEIDFEEFVIMMSHMPKRLPPAEEIRQIQAAFAIFDVDGDGEITLQELARLMSGTHGEPIPESELQRLIDVADKDGSGTVSMEEFVDMMVI